MFLQYPPHILRHLSRPLTAAAAAVALLLLSTAAWPHALHMFLSADDTIISGDVYYSDGKPAVGATITITTPAGETNEVTTGEDGLFSYTASAPGPHTVVADSHDGHRVEQTVEVGEAQALAGVEATHDPPHGEGAAIAGAVAQPASAIDVDPAIRAAVREEIRPLREDLNRFQNSARVRDIIAGIGYIVGVFGLFAWLKSRRPKAT